MKEKLLSNNYKLIFAQFFSRIGTLASYIEIIYLTTELTGTASTLGTLILYQSLPMFIIGTFFGWVLDKYSVKKIMIYSDILRFIIMLNLFIISKFYTIEMWHLYLSSFFISIFSALHKPSIQSLIAILTNSGKRRKYNSKLQLFDYIGTLLGPPLGSLFISLYGANINFLLD